MAFGTFSVVIDGAQYGGMPETSANVRVKANLGTLKFDDIDQFRFPRAEMNVALPFTLVLDTDVPSGATEDSEIIGYQVTVTTPLGGHVVADFAARPDGTTVALTDVTLDVVMPVNDVVASAESASASATTAAASATSAAASASAAATITGLTGEDAAVAFLVNDTASDTRAALWRVAPTTVNVRQYDVRPDRTAAENNAGLAALFAAHPAGVTLAFPDEGTYALTAPLPSRNNLGILGVGWGTILSWSAGSMLSLSTTVTGFRASNIGLENVTGAGHLIDVAATGGLIFATFDNVEMKSKATASSLIKVVGDPNFFGNSFTGCRMWRLPGHAVPAIDIAVTGAGVNTCRWRGGWWHSQGCASTPFLRAEVTSGSSYISKFTVEDVIGEQNIGGMIHLYSANAPLISNVVDHDALTAYADDLFKVGATAGPSSRGHIFRSSGTAGVATWAAGKVHLRDDSIYSDLGRVVNGGNVGTLAGSTQGRVVAHGGGRATSIRTLTSSVTAGLLDDVIVMNSATTRNVTLPDPTALLSSGTVPPGRTWTVKNIGAGATTVLSAGTATIDGAASVSLAQWASGRFVTDGINWFRL